MINQLKEINEDLKVWLASNEVKIQNISFKEYENLIIVLNDFLLIANIINSEILSVNNIKKKYTEVQKNQEKSSQKKFLKIYNKKILEEIDILIGQIDLYIDMSQDKEKEFDYRVLQKERSNFVLIKNKEKLYWLNNGKNEKMDFLSKNNAFKDKELLVIIGHGDGSYLKFVPNHTPVIVLDPFINEIPETNEYHNKEVTFIPKNEINSIKFSTLLSQYNGLDINFQINPYYENEILIDEIKNTSKEIILGLYEREIFNNTTRYFMIDWTMESLLNALYLEQKNGKVKDIRYFYETFSKEKALVISAGPSLSKAIRKVKQLQNTHFIIAIGQTYELLVNEGIVPDIWLSIDAGIANFNMHLKNVDTVHPLIHANLLNHNIIKNHKGLFFPITDSKEGLLKDVFAEAPVEHGFPSVANYAFYFAKRLGFSEIFLVGQDLAVRNGEYYSKEIFEKTKNTGSLGDEKLLIELNSGEIGETSNALKIFHSTFEAIVDFFPSKSKFYNTSYFGAKIKGFQFVDIDNISVEGMPLKRKIDWGAAPNIKMNSVQKNISKFIKDLTVLKKEVESWLEYNKMVLKKKKIHKNELVITLDFFNKIQKSYSYLSVVKVSLEKELIAFNNVFEYQLIDWDKNETRIKAFKTINQLILVILEYINKFIKDERYEEIKKMIG